MRCGSCAKDLPGEFKFCPYCGAEQALHCASCGGALQAGFAFCPLCGAPRVAPKKTTARASSAIPRPSFLAVARGGERRVVTVLFADVVGFTKLSERYDPETLTEMMNRLFERFGAVVRRYEGVVDKFIGDAAMVLFGAPTAHEDDAERAVLTARDMMALLPAVNEDFRHTLGIDPQLAIHVGIATGLVVAGAVGSDSSGGYTVMGDAVNLASRLVDLAPAHETYVSESTYRLVSGRVRAEVVQTVRVKGKEEPVTVYRVTGADPSAGDSRGLSAFYSPMVGRDGEVAKLREALGAIARGHGSFVVIEGAAGIGKSRLVRECLSDLSVAGVKPRVHVGRCISYGRNVPYYPWSQILASLLTESIMHRLKADQLAVLQQVSTGAFGNRTPAEAEKHRETVFWSFARLIASAADNSPRVLVLEDMHWADATTLDLALSLIPVMSASRVVLMVVFRTGTGAEVAAAVEAAMKDQDACAAFLDLTPLAADDTRILVSNLTCNVAGMPETLRGEIATRSQGIPLFVEEILRHYVEEGVLARDRGFWRYVAPRGDASGPTVPTTLHALLSARVDRHAPAQRTRLELGSVIGKDFDPRMVDALLGFPHDPEPWKALKDAGEIIQVPNPAGGRDRLRFAQVLTQEVIYGTLLRTRRQDLHLAVARALESDRVGQEENLHALAHHFEQAGQPERASPYWLAAARQARGLFANQEALDLYDHALRVAPSAQAAREALFGKAELLDQIGRTADAATAFERLVEMAQARSDVGDEAEVLCHRASVAYHQGDGAGILRYAERALERARRSGNPRVVAKALRQMGIGHEFAGRFDAARVAYEELLRIEEPFEDKPLLFGTTNSLGEIARASDRFEEAIAWYEKSHEGIGPTAINREIVYLGNLGAAYTGLGDYAKALELLDRCIDEKRRTGHLAFLAEACYYRGLAYLGLGRTADAAADACAAWTSATANRENELLGLALRLHALVRAAGGPATLGEADLEPEEALRQSVGVFHTAGKRGEEARSRWELGRYLLAHGRGTDGRAELELAMGLLRELGLDIPAARVERELAVTSQPAS